MSNFRSSGTLALPPQKYAEPKGNFFGRTSCLERFPPTYADEDSVFDEYMRNPSMMPSKHAKHLEKSTGLLELHYNKMRKSQKDRSMSSTYTQEPTMDRNFRAIAGYSGFIPGKDSDNIIGCTFNNSSRLTHSKFNKQPMSGLTFTIGGNRSQSLPRLDRMR
mmetsp:Transcript_106460/g.301183  ORF Transcript_106460/g.301183 Transcript_106460/m.301183 type:complete len:162 (-) Transcript_106460:138-623(-)